MKDRHRETLGYVTGLALALALTVAAFAAVRWPGLLGARTIAAVFGLALVQAIVHFRFFLHVRLRRSSRDDLVLLLFSSLIIVLMVSGTLILMMNLRARMM